MTKTNDVELRRMCAQALTNMKRTGDGEWRVAQGTAGAPRSWFPGLIRAVTSNWIDPELTPAMAHALVVALKDMQAGRPARTHTGCLARGYILGCIEAWEEERAREAERREALERDAETLELHGTVEREGWGRRDD